jgi:glycine betaine/proline transport system substrate-binding protein
MPMTTGERTLVCPDCRTRGRKVFAARMLLTGLLLATRNCDAADVRIAFFNNYLPAEIEANILARIAERHPALGAGRVVLVGTDVTPAWIGLQRGDTDVILEVDLPNQQALLDKAAGLVTTLGRIYADSGEGFFVPRYVVAGAAAPAPGLKRVDQLPAYKAVFGGTLYDESPGWQSSKYNAKRLKGYGIDFTHLQLSDAALVAEVIRADARKQPIVFFFAHPHWLFKRLDLQKLEEPNPYHEGCFETGDGRCAIPSFSAWVGARKDLAARAPHFYALLSYFAVPIDDIETMMLRISTEKLPVRDATAQWVDAHRAGVEEWVRQATAH